MSSLLLVLSGLLGGASAGASMVRHHHVRELPGKWAPMDAPLDPDQPFPLSIALRQPHIHRLAARFAPGSGHLSLDEVRRLRAPDQEDTAAVLDWLHENGINDTETKHDWIHVRTTVKDAERLLDTQLRHYSSGGSASRIRARQYSVPSHLSDAISFISPVSNFMTALREPTTHEPARDRSRRRRDEGAAGGIGYGEEPCPETMTPNCLRELYNMRYKAPCNTSRVRVGVSGFLNRDPNHADVRDFLQQQAPETAARGYDFQVELIGGGTDPQDRSRAGDEPQIDLEYVMALGFPSQVTFYATGGRGVKMGDDGRPVAGGGADNEPFLELVQALLDKPDDQVPHVLTLGYADDELSVPRPYAERVCGMLGLLTRRGASIIQASGDGGAAGVTNGTCLPKDSSGKRVERPTFPSSCPWVTAVGAVYYPAGMTAGTPYSSGGFSHYFERPAWQAAAVDAYAERVAGWLNSHYNTSMRGVPDISVAGDNFVAVVGGSPRLIGGTSAAMPVFAAMIALVNDARLRRGKPSLGWLNPALYSDKVVSVLHDVTDGSSKPCSSEVNGWLAMEGWDAITGLGVPKDFAQLLEVLEQV